ncbi:aspartyl/asparaginyl beta-hydroxylase [Naegleria gruberi]|uniref:Aspartyl/asparaginyl beta-hydroxylase n=1 Tax=Naegleria gruberi TaxID=5762 RepID=D2VM56_NAEGR|nr:aspartyl/asparaginyl beta-hydroxylase [Naegleria gruberi]EFC42262.1 aspartyl/asparaginyl beta-hydroxylase [Naegleria gruberi]|eukprot:XP_002675006.1 aspartyl/asparaginyl beta-hydroxylase [Naegleria gruberi strain NEG-M]
MSDQFPVSSSSNNEETTFNITEDQRKNNPDNNPIRDQQVIEKKIKKLQEIHQDWHVDNNCTCCKQEFLNNTINNNNNTINNTSNTNNTDNNTTDNNNVTLPSSDQVNHHHHPSIIDSNNSHNNNSHNNSNNSNNKIIITTDNVHLSGENVKKEYNTDRGLYWDWLSMDDVGKKCFYYKNDPFSSLREEYSNISKFFSELESNYDLIRSELDELLKQEENDFQAWPETICKTKGKWKVYPLGFAFGRDLTNEPTKCPKSVQLLSRLNKEYNVHITTAGFSCLSSNCYISAHKGYCGYSNHCLRVHMGLIVPSSNHHACAIRVGNIRHCWNERVVFGFDDYITHEAYNFTDQDRYILLLDIRFREVEKFKFYDKNSNQSFIPNVSIDSKLIHSNLMLNQQKEQSDINNNTNNTIDNTIDNNIDNSNTNDTSQSNDDDLKWKGISSSTLSNSTAPKTFVTLSKYVTNDIECLNANYSDELKDMLKNVVDKN